MAEEKKGFSRHIEKDSESFLQSKEEKNRFWHYASMVGMGGWLFALPVVVGAYLGRYLDHHYAQNISWTLTLIVLGVFAGIYNLWEFLLQKGKP